MQWHFASPGLECAPPSRLCTEGVLCRSWIPAPEPSIPISSTPKSQPALQEFGGPAEATKDPPFPRDRHNCRAGPGWDPSSHQYRVGASSPSEGTLVREGLPPPRQPLSWGWAASPLQEPAGTPSRQHFGGAAGRAGGSCPLWDPEHPSSQGQGVSKAIPPTCLPARLPEAVWRHVPVERGGWDWDTPVPNPILLSTKHPQSQPPWAEGPALAEGVRAESLFGG